jgi:polar amino acid transport system permease protein
VAQRYHIDLSVIWDYRRPLVTSLWISLELLILSLALGFVIGILVGMGRLSHRRLLALPCTVYVEVFRGIPPLIQLFWFYYAFPQLFHVGLSEFSTGVLALSLLAGAYVGEIVRAGIQSIHKGQIVAARGLGLSHMQAMRDVILPQAIRRMIPPLISQSVDVFKATALASTITVHELMYETYYATSQTFRFVEFYTTAALVYFCIALPMISYVRRLEVHVGF